MNLNEQITDFLIINSYFTDREPVERDVSLHLQYKTILVFKDGDKIIGVATWNIKNDTAYILDIIIAEGYRNRGVMQDMIRKGLDMWKDVKFYSWSRGRKYPNRIGKIYSVNKLIKEKI